MRLPIPEPGDEVGWVATHLGHLACDRPAGSPRFRGTQAAADAAVAAFDVTGYAARRNEVLPVRRRGASALSPYIRHGLLTLPDVWAAVDGPSRDREKFRDELLWQEYARHLTARLGSAMAAPLRHLPGPTDGAGGVPWDRSMACVAACLDELETDGWLVNQTRMWLASDWTVRHGQEWRAGEDQFFRHLLDGSRAANRAGWQWTVGTATGRPYGFSRWQVEKRAPELCRRCDRRDDCPIAEWPDAAPGPRVEPDPRLRSDPDPEATAGPRNAERNGEPDAVWLTAESLGDADPALAARADLPAVFVFDEPLLARLALSGKRLVFLTERLAELATRREVEIHLGRPEDELAGRRLAATFTPVPGWRRRATRLEIVERHPWTWLRRPGTGSLASFSSWAGDRSRPRR